MTTSIQARLMQPGAFDIFAPGHRKLGLAYPKPGPLAPGARRPYIAIDTLGRRITEGDLDSCRTALAKAATTA